MPDLLSTPPAQRLLKTLGAPTPAPLRRYAPNEPLLPAPALFGGAKGGRLRQHAETVAKAAGATIFKQAPEGDQPLGALVFDATAITSSAQLRELYDFFHPVVRRIAQAGRIVVLGTPPASCADVGEAVAQRALEGFERSLAKEIGGKGATANLVYVEPGAEDAMASTLRFLLSARSAYVDAQVIEVSPAVIEEPGDWALPLAGRVAVVTGASRGIGEAIAATLARDGAHVVCLDVPAQGSALTAVANRIGGSTLQLDITSAEAPRVLADHLTARHGGVDAIVHNAGVTRDRTLGRMSEDEWDVLLDINLTSTERIDAVLLGEEILNPDGRIVGVSSISGIAGNRGQVNYATSKAGVIGRVEALSRALRGTGRTINAVAPGFIETQMTAAMPFATREVGKRINSLAQGGLPIDVAETVAWFAAPASGGLNGNVTRVCGQQLLGA
jgi:3-oxoacyl-[acyl-carrier protein] reductase